MPFWTDPEMAIPERYNWVAVGARERLRRPPPYIAFYPGWSPGASDRGFCFFYFTLRYLFDFAPFITLTSLIGYRSVSIAIFEAQGRWVKRRLIAGIGRSAVGIVFSHYVLPMHKAWSMAVPMEVRLALIPFLPSAYCPCRAPCREAITSEHGDQIVQAQFD